MKINTRRRLLIHELPASIVLTMTGAATSTQTVWASKRNKPKVFTEGSLHATPKLADVQDCKVQLPFVVDDSELTATLPESMACEPGVWRVCVEEDCIEVCCWDVELANNCTITSAAVVAASEVDEDALCQCP